MESFNASSSVEIIRPEIDSLLTKQELSREPSQEELQKTRIASDILTSEEIG